jgi:hypothetical protein
MGYMLNAEGLQGISLSAGEYKLLHSIKKE